MNLLIVMVTHNRLEYSKNTLKNLIATIKVPYFLIVADNASTDGTIDYMRHQLGKGNINYLITNEENFYPGKATNEAWQTGLSYYPEATHLMRLDNDMALSEDWSDVVQDYFDSIPNLGQLGLDYGPTQLPDASNFVQEHHKKTINPYPGNVGGTNVIRREVWEDGVKYDETPWFSNGKTPEPQEDCRFSLDISEAGWLFGHSTKKIAWTIDKWEDYPEYYLKTMVDRGYSEVYKDELNKLRDKLND